VAFTQVTVTRDYDLATGSAPSGQVSFTPSDWLVNSGVTVPAAPVVALLDAAGKVAVVLVANTDPDTVPAGSYYLVQEDITGQPRRIYQITIPASVGGFTVDIEYLRDPGGAGYGIGGYGITPYGG